MILVYNQEHIPENCRYSIFLAGPTPRYSLTPSWRPHAIIEIAGLLKIPDVAVIVPENRDREIFKDVLAEDTYQAQVDWEQNCLDSCTAIMMWVPRDLKTMPAFTTNVEFGLYIREQKFFYGRPDSAEKNRYLDRSYENLNPNYRGSALGYARDLETLADRVVFYIEKKDGVTKRSLSK
jgi:hypothetical protein